jgi:tetratricopeptide (TPR) repeat protein
LHAAGSLATRQGDYEAAGALFEESLAIWEKLEDGAGTARSLLSMGTVAAEQGDQERAIELSERAAELYGESGDQRGHALAISNLGGIALERGEYAKAASLSEQAYGLFETLDDSEGMAFALVNQGFAALSEKQHERAIELLRQALRRLAELEFKDVIGYCFEGLAAVLAFTRRPEEAAKLLGAAEALRESLGVGLAPAEQTTHDETVEAVRAALDEQHFGAAWRQGRELPLEDAIAYALEDVTARVRP